MMNARRPVPRELSPSPVFSDNRDHLVPTVPQEPPPHGPQGLTARRRHTARSSTVPVADIHGHLNLSPRGLPSSLKDGFLAASGSEKNHTEPGPTEHQRTISRANTVGSECGLSPTSPRSPRVIAQALMSAAEAVSMAKRQQVETSSVKHSPTFCTDRNYGHHMAKVVLANRFCRNVRYSRQLRMETGGVYTASADERLMVEQEFVKSPMLRNCSASFIEELARTAKFRKLRAGPVSDHEAEALASRFLLVLSGDIRVLQGDQMVAHLVPGSHYGEPTLLGLEVKAKVGFSSEAHSTVVEISREDLGEVLKDFESERRWFSNIYLRNCSMTCTDSGTLEKPCQLFYGLDADVINDIDASMLRRFYFPGERIVEEGAECEELLVLAFGRAGVEIAGRIVRYASAGMPSEDGDVTKLGGERTSMPESPVSFRPRRLSRTATGAADGVDGLPLSCFGELGLLGLEPRHATSVVAKTVCHFRVLHRSIYAQVLAKHGAEPGLARVSSIADLPRPLLGEIAAFKEVACRADFLEFLEGHLEMRLYAPGQQIVEEAEHEERCLYIIARGTAVASKGDEEVGRLTAGEAFGAVLGVMLPTGAGAAVVAEDTCYVRILHQGVIMRGLELFPHERKHLLLRASTTRRNSCTSSATDAVTSPTATSIGRRTPFFDSDEEVEGEEEPGSPSADAFAASELSRLRDPGMRGAIMKVLRNSHFFADCSEEFVDEIASTSVDRIYMPGENIIEEGQRGDSMFVMISGSAGIFVADPEVCVDPQKKIQAMADTGGLSAKAARTRVASLHPGSISGELAMLGISPFRAATIQAETICSMWEISQDDGIAFLERFPESRLHFRQVIVQHLERTVMARMLHLPMLQLFSRKFLTLLALYCEREAYFPGDVIVKEGSQGFKLYIINIGTAQLFHKGVTVKSYGAGGIFGASVMLGIHKAYFGSLVALQTCHVVRIPKSSFQHAMEQYPSQQAALKLRKNEELVEEEFRGAMQRVATRKLVWNRYQGSLNNYSVANLSELEMLIKTLESWKTFFRQVRDCRARKQDELERHTKDIREYCAKRREQLSRAQELAIERDVPRSPSRASSPSRCRSVPPRSESGSVVASVPSCELPMVGRGRSEPCEELAKIVSTWSLPRPSPFYQLRVFNVLAKTLERPTIAGPLLPLIQQDFARRSQSLHTARGAQPKTARASSPERGADHEKRLRLPDV